VFQYGSRVRVRATGRIVMVKCVSQDGVACSWYEPSRGWQEGVFPAHAIQKYDRHSLPSRGVQPAAVK
jgi:hypothetical protein